MIPLNVWTSLAVFCRNLGTGAQMVDWEDFTNILELPAQDLIGPMGIGIDEVSPEMFEITFSIGVSTFQDQGMFRHREMISKVFDALRVGRTIPVYDAGSEKVFSWMKVLDGTALAPVARTATRPFQFVQVRAALDPSLGG